MRSSSPKAHYSQTEICLEGAILPRPITPKAQYSNVKNILFPFKEHITPKAHYSHGQLGPILPKSNNPKAHYSQKVHRAPHSQGPLLPSPITPILGSIGPREYWRLGVLGRPPFCFVLWNSGDRKSVNLVWCSRELYSVKPVFSSPHHTALQSGVEKRI